MKRYWRFFIHDGINNDGEPYWILPSDRKTTDFTEWLQEDDEYRKSKLK